MIRFDRRQRPWPSDERPPFIDESCDRYELEWRATRAPRIEDYLGDLQGEARTALWLELALLDQELRRGRGEMPTLADYRESCPDRMVWLQLSTDGPGLIASPGSVAGEATGAGRGAGPIAAGLDADRMADRAEPLADPETSTAASREDATDPSGLPSTAGPPVGGQAEGLDGLAIARPGAAFGDYLLLPASAPAAWASSSRPASSGSTAPSRSR